MCIWYKIVDAKCVDTNIRDNVLMKGDLTTTGMSDCRRFYDKLWNVLNKVLLVRSYCYIAVAVYIRCCIQKYPETNLTLHIHMVSWNKNTVGFLHV